MTAKVSWLGRQIRILRLARRLHQQAQSGYVLVPVPSWLRAEACSWLYQRQVEHYRDKWAGRAVAHSLADWQAAVGKAGERL